MWKEEGKGVSFFFQNFFFIVDWLGKGGQGFFNIYMLKMDGRGKGLIFLQIHYGGGGGGGLVGSIHFQNKRH
jgi:hypothetical protein